MPKLRIFNVTNMPFNDIRENKILAKISGFTVHTEIMIQNVNRNAHQREATKQAVISISCVPL